MKLIFTVVWLALLSPVWTSPTPISCWGPDFDLSTDHQSDQFADLPSSNMTCQAGERLNLSCTPTAKYDSKHWHLYAGALSCTHNGIQQDTTTVLQWWCLEIIFQCVYMVNGSSHGSRKIHVKPEGFDGDGEQVTTTTEKRSVAGRHELREGADTTKELRAESSTAAYSTALQVHVEWILLIFPLFLCQYTIFKC